MYQYPPFYPGNNGYYYPPIQPPLAYVLANHFGPHGNGPVSVLGMHFLSVAAPNLRPQPPYNMPPPQYIPYIYQPPPPPPPPLMPHRHGHGPHVHINPYRHECCGGYCTPGYPRGQKHHGPRSAGF
ncbi:hypothetical protein F4781DRAFT_357850 [Annulohypoxylon bovei var. microspora]|nr:hypothetical protein F4781DRAFT_357850 [Annulohypoxylon bovei var. microspora]